MLYSSPRPVTFICNESKYLFNQIFTVLLLVVGLVVGEVLSANTN